MVEIKFIVATKKFEKDVKKIEDRRLKIRIEKQVRKIIETPEVGKPLRYDLKGERTVSIKPYRLIYKVEEDRLILLRCEHREIVYRRH
ncbi:MAG: type II toxin-antitoxin system mRNA interferase toxin, RelE/StbE family [Candidatus Bathyarchaeota archaeon]|nr:type II toxin-antitoxin system mRNA interferase toxin, RelE/StbE family [Candidatus Bathyarchaeota archaeon]